MRSLRLTVALAAVVLVAGLVAVAVHHSPGGATEVITGSTGSTGSTGPSPIAGPSCPGPQPPGPVIVVPAGGDAAPAPSPSPLAQLLPSRGNPAPATKLARSMLARTTLPPAHRSATPPSLAQPFSQPASANLVDLHDAWTVAEPAETVVAFLTTHSPAGMSCDGSGYEGDRNGATSENVTFALTTLPGAIRSAQLLVEVIATSTTTSAVRADAQVIFAPPRSRQEQVPNSDVVATVVRSGSLRNGQDAAASRTVTDTATVARLAGILNGLPAAVPGATSCPAMSVQYRVSFSKSIGGAPDLVATATGCDGVGVTTGGVTQPALDDGGGAFFQAVAALFGTAPAEG